MCKLLPVERGGPQPLAVAGYSFPGAFSGTYLKVPVHACTAPGIEHAGSPDF